MKNQRGQTLVEMVVMLVIMGLTATAAVPTFASAHRQAALRRATEQVRAQMWMARSEAVTTGYATALVFDRLDGGGWRCTVVRDGDGDGVRHADMAAGIDLPVRGVLELRADQAGLGFVTGVPIPDPSGNGAMAGDLDDPVRAGSGDVLTFTPQGTSTSGTLYFSDGHRAMRALRIFGVTGRFRTLKWQVGWDKWRVAGL